MKRMLVALALGAALQGPASAAPMFPDVPETHWAYEAVKVLAEKGIIEGYPAPGERTFQPSQPPKPKKPEKPEKPPKPPKPPAK